MASSVAEEVLRQQLRHAELFVISPPLNAEQEIGSGRTDVFVTDHAGSRRLRDKEGWRVTAPPATLATPPTPMPCRTGTMPGWPN